MQHQDDLPPLSVGLARFALKAMVIVGIAVGIHFLMGWAETLADKAGSGGLMLGLFTLLLLSYALLIAIPFVPGIEIGISLLFLRGAEIAPFVYLATVLGLTLAYVVGRCVPYRWLHDLLADLRLKRACALIERLEPMSREERLRHLERRLPQWATPVMRAGRYVVLGLLYNVPGNAVIGGGGGISFAAGFSRLFRPSLTILMICVAVLPVPLTVWFAGSELLQERVEISE